MFKAGSHQPSQQHFPLPAVTTLAWFLLPSVYLHNMPSMPSKQRRSYCEAQPFPLNSKCCVLSKSVLTEQDQIHLLTLPLQPAPAVFLFLQQAKVPTISLYFSYYSYPVDQQISSALTPKKDPDSNHFSIPLPGPLQPKGP